VTEQAYKPQPNDDEIDLVELFQSLWEQKLLIVLVALIFAAAAASYALLSKPVYEASAVVLPPSISDIAGLNLGRTGTVNGGLEPFLVSDVYAVFIQNLESDKSRRKFFTEYYLPSLDEIQRAGSRDSIYKAFNNKFIVKAMDKNQPARYLITIEDYKPDLASFLVRQYIDQVGKRSLDDMLHNSEREFVIKAQNIERQIKSERNSAKIRKDDREKQLNEALIVADAIGLDNPPVVNTELSAFMDGSLMYMRGSKSLRAELEVLRARTSNDPFIPELRDYEAKYQLFTDVNVDREKVSVFRLDGEISVPDQAIKPKKALIIALGVFLGAMLGVLVAIIRMRLAKHSTRVG